MKRNGTGSAAVDGAGQSSCLVRFVDTGGSRVDVARHGLARGTPGRSNAVHRNGSSGQG
jgi:hypothetical protein